LSNFEPINGTHVIGIGHKARHGKDTAAERILRSTGGVARKYSFGTGLYAVARALFNMTAKDAPLLQALGTEVGRRHDNDRWIRTTYWQIRDERPRIAVLADVRFPNEADFVKSMGGTLIKVTRLDAGTAKPYITTDRDPNHPSEVALDGYTNWDYRLEAYNVDDLREHVDNVLWDLRDKLGE
jgi:hypothetical protein